MDTQTRKNDLILELVTRKYNVPQYAQRQYLSIAHTNKNERPAYIRNELDRRYKRDTEGNVFNLVNELLAGKTVHIQSPEYVWGLDEIHTGWIKCVGDDEFEWHVERTYDLGVHPHEISQDVTDTEGAYKILSTAVYYSSTLTVKDVE